MEKGFLSQRTEDFMHVISAACHHLEEKWEQLQLKLNSFTKLQSDFFQQELSKISNDDVIRLNCGGEYADIKRHALFTSTEEHMTLLHFFFSSMWEKFLLKDKHNRTYLDLDISWIKPIFGILREDTTSLAAQKRNFVPVDSMNYFNRTGYQATLEYLQIMNTSYVKDKKRDVSLPPYTLFHTTSFTPLYNIQAKEEIYQLILDKFPQFKSSPTKSFQLTQLVSITSNAHTSCPINITNQKPLLILYYVDNKIFGALHSLDNGWTIEKWQTNVTLFSLDALFATNASASSYLTVSCYMQPDSISYCQSSNTTTTMMFIPFHHKRERGGYYNERLMPSATSTTSSSSSNATTAKERYAFFQSNLQMEIYWIHTQEIDEETNTTSNTNSSKPQSVNDGLTPSTSLLVEPKNNSSIQAILPSQLLEGQASTEDNQKVQEVPSTLILSPHTRLYTQLVAQLQYFHDMEETFYRDEEHLVMAKEQFLLELIFYEHYQQPTTRFQIVHELWERKEVIIRNYNHTINTPNTRKEEGQGCTDKNASLLLREEYIMNTIHRMVHHMVSSANNGVAGRTKDALSGGQVVTKEEILFFNICGEQICILKDSLMNALPNSQLARRISGAWQEQSTDIDEQGRIVSYDFSAELFRTLMNYVRLFALYEGDTPKVVIVQHVYQIEEMKKMLDYLGIDDLAIELVPSD